MAEVKTISTEELRQRLRENDDLQFWNVLEDDYFTGEMIPGSRRVRLSDVGREVSDTQLPKDTEIVVHCTGPTCPVSGMAAEKLMKLGYTDVRAYEGGLKEWKAAGLEVKGEPATAGSA